MDIKYHYDVSNPLKVEYQLIDRDDITTSSLPEAFEKAAVITKERMSKLGIKKAAVCLSGIDSELAVHYLHKVGVNVEAWTVNVDHTNQIEVTNAQLICARYNIPFHEFHLSTDEGIKNGIFHEVFNIGYSCRIAYTQLTPLFKVIPDDYYIVCGDGGMSHIHDLYWRVYNFSPLQNFEFDIENNFYFPIDVYTHISPKLVLDGFKKHGNTTVWSSCWDVWYHILRHPLLRTNKFWYYEDHDLKESDFAFLNLINNKKTSFNRGTPAGLKCGLKLSRYIHRNLIPSIPNYQKFAGTVVTIPHTMIQ